ncbi:MAG: BBP7 family outer membrane beta-barrel protein, partial [Maioricimonas sp. JB049]
IYPLPETQFAAISLLTDGIPGATVLLNDAGLTASFTSQLWGADANIYFDYKAPRLGWRVQPLLGFRHTEYEENVGVIGLFDNRSGLDPTSPVLATPIERRIWSNANNFRYGLQTGFRSEFAHEHFTLGVEPKVTFGANYYQAEVMTNNLRNSTFPVVVDDPATRSSVDKTEFAPTFDLGVYGKLHLTDYFHLRVGYTFVWMGNIARADRVIYYNDLGTGNPPAVAARADTTDMWLQALTIGGEFRFP